VATEVLNVLICKPIWALNNSYHYKKHLWKAKKKLQHVNDVFTLQVNTQSYLGFEAIIKNAM